MTTKKLTKKTTKTTDVVTEDRDDAMEKARQECKAALQALESLLPMVSRAAALFAESGCTADTVTLSRTFEPIEELVSKVAPELRPLS